MDFGKKPQSRAYIFFDRLFRLFICNILSVASMAIPCSLFIFLLMDLGINYDPANMDTLMMLFWIAVGSFLITFPFLILPAITASTITIKEVNSSVKIFKEWFYNFKLHYVKSMLLGLIYASLFGIALFALYFYSNVNLIEVSNPNYAELFMKIQNVLLQAGFVVVVIFIIALTCLVVHVPLLIITLPKFSVIDLLKTNIFMSINHFVNTMILVAMLIVSIIGFTFFPIWIIFGISLPIMIGIRFSKVNYLELEKVDFEKINELVDEELEKEE